MGDDITNRRGVTDGMDALLQRFGFGARATARQPFTRYFPRGAQVGPLSLATTTDELSDPRGRLFTCGPAYSLYLDPHYTTPGREFAVHFGEANDSIRLFPGEGIDVPQGFDRVFVWDPVNRDAQADGWLARACQPAAGATKLFCGSACAFLIGRALGARPHFGSQPRSRNGRVGQVFTGVGATLLANAPSEAKGSKRIPTGGYTYHLGGATGVRFGFHAINAAGAEIARPADFGGTVRIWGLTRQVQDDGLVSGVSVETVDGPIVGGGGASTVDDWDWTPAGALDMAVTQVKALFDLSLPVGYDALYLQRATDAGNTGVDHIDVTVEVF